MDTFLYYFKLVMMGLLAIGLLLLILVWATYHRKLEHSKEDGK